MQKQLILLFIVLVGIVSISCNRRAAHHGKAHDESAMEKQDKFSPEMAVNQLAMDILKQHPANGENLVFSPFSISTALAMTYLGAREETKEEMARILYFTPDHEVLRMHFKAYIQRLKSLDTDSVSLNVANSLWAQIGYHFLESYFDITGKAFDAPVKQLDFVTQREQARLKINQWVLEQTRDMIRDLIAPDVLTEDTRLVLVNAIYFHGLWAQAFDPEQTFEDVFQLNEDHQTMVNYMFREGNVRYAGNDSLQVIDIPYAGGEFSMTIILPAEDLTLADLEKKLSTETLEIVYDQMEELIVRMYIPSFEAETKINLEETLMQMGLKLPFDKRADFSGMTGKKDLKIDKVIHQARIKVEETGTEAAAATAVVVIRKTAIDPDQPVIFRANRPYLFFIRENAGQSILFSGRVMDPGTGQ